MITELKNMWVVVGSSNYPQYSTIGQLKSESIKLFLENSSITWKEAKKYGWKCLKVSILFVQP